MNYYEHHLGDYAAATAHLSWDEDMAYTRLLRAYYHHERGIAEGQQYRIARASTPAQRRAVDTVLAEFFVLADGTHTQKRADAEIARYQDKQRKAKASADARWSHTGRKANASPNAMRTHSEGNAPSLQTPDTSDNPPPPAGGVFAQFWSQWPESPRKVAESQCLRRWERMGLDSQGAEVLAGLQRWRDSSAWAKDGGEYVPAPLLWLKQSRWLASTEAEAEAVKAAATWHDTRSGIVAKGVELGLGAWDEAAAGVGQGEQFPVYMARVFKAAGHSTVRAA